MYNYKEHANMLFEVSDAVNWSLMASRGLRHAHCELTDEQFKDAAAGVFGLITEALEKAQILLINNEIPFMSAHGLTYGNGKAVEKSESHNNEASPGTQEAIDTDRKEVDEITGELKKIESIYLKTHMKAMPMLGKRLNDPDIRYLIEDLLSVMNLHQFDK